MKKNKSVLKIVSMLVCIFLLASFFAVGVFAIDPGDVNPIVIQAENAVNSYVDMTDTGSWTHSNRVVTGKVELAADSPGAIMFRAADWYEYTFTVEVPGTYSIAVRTQSDRPSHFDYTLDGGAEVQAYLNPAPGWIYTMCSLGSIVLTAGEHTIRFANVNYHANKNHNCYVDYYELTCTEVDAGYVPAPTPTLAPTPTPIAVNPVTIQAEYPVDSYVDLVNRIDVNGNPMDHSGRVVNADGVEIQSDGIIKFSSYDWYKYTFNIDVAGLYKLEVKAGSDRHTHFDYVLDGNDQVNAWMTANAYQQQLFDLGNVELSAGTHTITFYNDYPSNENKNHNSYVDYYKLTCIEVYASSTSVSLTKSGDDFVVGINGWNGTHEYQIWTYQKTQSEIFGGEGLTNQWVLSHPYTLGSDRGANGFTVDGDAITRKIGPFNSVDSNYTVAVKVIDGEGNFVGQYKDTFTQAEAGEVVINKVTVDGQFADDKAFVKDIANDSPVAFVVTGNGVAGTVYTAKVDQTGDQLVASGAGLNEFSWDISLMQPGNYSVTLTASTADSSDSRTVNINLYKNDPAVVYGEMTELVVTGAAENDNFKIDINPTVTGGKFRYRISEPWRGTIPGGDSELVEIPAAPLSNTAIPRTAYGVYEVQTFTYRDGVSSADDGAVRTVTNVRPGEPVTLNVTVDGNPAGAEMITKAKGTAIVFTPAATGLPLPQYSFWRRDANGWVLIRDYSGEGLTWTPNRVGLYTIQVRAKATGGLTYEVLKNIEFDITDATDKKAVVTGIAINQAVLDTDAKTRTPILITANATSAEQDLLYKFIISNGYIYYVETAYSADPTYMWVPGKAGNYTISVLVKNQASFGKYDAVETFTVTVQ